MMWDWEETAIPNGGGTFQPAFTPGVGIPHYRPSIPTNQSTLFLRVMRATTCEDLSKPVFFGSPRSSESIVSLLRKPPTDIDLCSAKSAQEKTTLSSLLHGMG